MNLKQIILGMQVYSENEIDFILGKEEQILLLNYINQLQNNWNELKKWLEETRKYETWCEMAEAYDIVINKMQELEGNNGN